MAQSVLGDDRDEERFIAILACASFASARRFVQIVAAKSAARLSTGKRPGRIDKRHGAGGFVSGAMPF
jgi:hypothetical protein